MRRAVVGFVMVACMAAYGQEMAQINFVGDDTGYVWVNGTQITVDTNWVGYAPVHVGKNVLAFWVWDHCWTGGFCASIDANNGVDTPHTDASVRCIDYPVPTGGTTWRSDTNYDDSQWQLAGDYGPLADDTGGNAKRLFLNTGIKVAQLWYDKAHWIWTPKRILMRKTFNTTQTSGTVYLRGNGCTYTLYVNGQQALQSTTRIRWGASGTALAQSPVALNNGQNVVAIDATCLDSVDFAWVKIAVQWTGGRVTSDSTWKDGYADPSPPTGWNNVGFNDAAWPTAGIKNCQYDGVTDNLTAVPGMWVTDYAFRMVFEIKAPVRSMTPPKAIPTNAKVTGVQYYTLQGSLVPAETVRMLRYNTTVVERTSLADGRTVSKMIQIRK